MTTTRGSAEARQQRSPPKWQTSNNCWGLSKSLKAEAGKQATAVVDAQCNAVMLLDKVPFFDFIEHLFSLRSARSHPQTHMKSC